MSANTTAMFEYDVRAGEAPKDDLFFERLDTFMEKCLGDIKAFAERELRPYEETRRCIAQWHAKYLFQPSTASSSTLSRTAQVRATLCDTSRILESLSETSGVQSFLLAVDPKEASDGGFLGGSVIGREFWRGMRGGGETGARAFKAFSTTHLETKPKGIGHAQIMERNSSTPPPKGGAAKSIKSELYESVRNALRTASGVRGAEMKWTNPERLDVYGVRLVGWPEGVPSQNPSTLKVSQNRLLLESIQNGSMRFERNSSTHPSSSGHNGGAKVDDEDPNEDFSWAYDADARSPSPPPEHSAAVPSSPFRSSPMRTNTTPVDKSDSEHNVWTLDSAAQVDPTLSSYSVDYPWGPEFSEGMVDTLGEEWEGESHSQLERPRKRPRSEEPFSGMDSNASK
ncbi:hypothetical protein BDZ97DRAFT_1697040 [Flammula alnicola]|nr:hypothetical protein BDZ97DRAFT_1697040 [Flammula alnicola]